MFKQVAPASSLSWHITYVHPVRHQLCDWFKYKVTTEYAAEGTPQNMHIFGIKMII